MIRNFLMHGQDEIGYLFELDGVIYWRLHVLNVPLRQHASLEDQHKVGIRHSPTIHTLHQNTAYIVRELMKSSTTAQGCSPRSTRASQRYE